MFKIFTFHQKAWLTILIATYTTVSSCGGRYRKKATTTPSLKSSTDPATPTASTTTSIGDTKPDNLNGSTDSLNSQTSSSSEISSGSSSSGVSSGSSSSGVSSGYASSRVSSGSFSSGVSSGYASSRVSSGSFSSGISSGYASSGVSSESVYSAASPPPAPTVFAGLPNIGNRCYMNAVLQIIAALYADKVEAPLKDIITKINTTHKPLDYTEVYQFINSLPESPAKTTATSSRQHDVEEFISDLNKQSPFLDPITVKDCEYTLRSSDVQDLLDLTYRSESKVFFLNVGFEGNQAPASMSEMINESSITSEQPIPESEHSFLTRNNYLLPDRLFIKLNRHGGNYKIMKAVNNAMHITIQSDFSKQSTNAFDLNGFIVHEGNESGGHYIAYVKREGKWYKANDARVTEIGESEARQQSKQGYLFFYTKVK